MDNTTNPTVTVESPTVEHKSVNLLAPDITMLILTWVTFFALLAVLQKLAWKPIVDMLEKREKEIRDALDNADKAKSQLAQIEEEKQRILNEAKSQAAKIVEDSRKIAKDLAADIEAKSRQHAQDLIKSAHEEISGEKQRLMKTLRQESAEVAISLATKIIGENMDQDKNRKLVQKEIEQI